MSAYVPPQRRGLAGGDPRGVDRDMPSNQDRDGRFAFRCGRVDGLCDDDDAPRKGKGKGGCSGERRSIDSGSAGRGGGERSSNGGPPELIPRDNTEGGDWRKRADRWRGQVEERSELEVFGEVKQLSTVGIDLASYDAIPVQVTGNNAENLEPIQRFSDARLKDALAENLRRCGYERPTPVQKHSIPMVASGQDLMACAQTGSGKTCAFMVPCLESLLRSGPPPNPSGSQRPKPMPCGLVLAPTRELAIQIHVEACKFAYDTGIRCCIVYGGADMWEQQMDLEKGCDILIATPGRLTDMCNRQKVSLKLVQFLILDEADRMLDMGFEPQVRDIVESFSMGRSSAHPRQSMMFSATFAREVQIMARDFLNDYIFISVGRVGAACDLIEQRVVYAGELEQKCRSLERAIKENLPKDGLAIVFVETKRAADTLELHLHESRVPVTAIHGDRTQSEREEALFAFKSGANPILVATDVAARGLHIDNVRLVVNFDMPKQVDDYVHRIGRTGRAGQKGVAIAFVTERCNYLPELGDLLAEAKQDLPPWFSDLCGNAQRPAASQGKGRQNKFGGVDLRMGEQTQAQKDRAPAEKFWQQPQREPNSFGNTGAMDAW